MKHGKKILKMGRTASHRKATLQSMSAALFEHKRIKTTLGKAKALRRYVEPIITTAKDDSTHARRLAFKKLGDKQAVKTLYNEVAPEVGNRPGGYTRIVKLGQRGGDAAEMAIVELVDYNDVQPEGSAGGSKKRTRRGGGGGRRRRSSSTTPSTSSAPASQEAEAVTSDAANPDATGNPQVPTQGDHPDHGDAEQGAAPGTGEPIPDAQAENQGRSGDNR